MNDPTLNLISALNSAGFDPVESGPDSWKARCPAHDDRDPSLSIGRGDDGRALVHCFVGCEIEAIVSAIGLTTADLFVKDNRHENIGPSKSRNGLTEAEVVAKLAKRCGTPGLRHSYLDPAGCLIFKVVRFDDGAGHKTFRPIHLASDGWKAGDPPGKLPLFHLPELAKATRIYVVEGEKCAWILLSLGLASTTSAHGAKSAKKSDWSPLAGKEVIILPDHDEPGEKYAKDVIDHLTKLSPRPKVLVVRLPGLEEGEDVEQWQERLPDQWSPEQARVELERLVDEARKAAENPEAHGIICLADIEPRELEWLWPGRVPLGTITTLAGDPGLGKSFLTLDMAARVSAGLPWPDTPDIPNPVGGVVVFSAEDDLETTVVQRLDAAGADRKRIFTSSALISLENIEILEATICHAKGVRLVVVDPIGAFAGKIDDHRNSDVRGLLKPLSELAQQYRLAIVLVTHLNKASSEKSLARVMGSLAWTAAARAVWAVVKDRDSPERRLLLPVKCNLAPDSSGLAYRIAGTPPKLEWESDPVTMHADDALATTSPTKADNSAKADEWLLSILVEGPRYSEDIFKRGQTAGFTKKSLYRAKDKAAIKARKSKTRFGGPWYWALPSDDPNREPEEHELGEDGQDPELLPFNGAADIEDRNELFDSSTGEYPQPSSPSWPRSAPSWVANIPEPRPMPPDFKPTNCVICHKPMEGEYRGTWDGDQPIAECWPCVHLLSN